MANGTRSSQLTGDDKSNSSKERKINVNRSTSSTAGSQDASSLRRSQRQTTLQKSTGSPPSIRMSGRLEKESFKTPPATRKSEGTENPKSSSPLRRSDRFKMFGSNLPVRRSDLPDMRSKKEKSVMQLNMETEELREEEEQQSNSSPEEKRRMNSRTYRAFVRKQREARAKDPSGNLSIDRSHSGNSTSHGSSNTHLIDVAVDCDERYEEGKRDDSTHQISVNTLDSTPSKSAKPPSLKHICIENANGFTDENGSDGQPRVDRNPQIQELEHSTSNTESHHSEVDAAQLVLEREKQVADDHDIHTTKADAIPSSCCSDNGENLSQAPRACCKRQRIDHTQKACPKTKLDPELYCSSTVKQAGAGESQRATITKLMQFPSGVSHELYNNCEIVNKLHQYKGRKAIMFDDQERVKKVISFIASFSNSNSRPFLIISTSSALHSWEKEFLHLVPFMNVMVYIGNKEIQESIHKQKLFDEGGRMIPQVLITSPEVVNKDLHLLNCIEWEVLIVDECQSPKISSQFQQIKTLHTNMWLLVASGQLKGGLTEYRSVLSLLEHDGDSNSSDNLLADSNETICDLKERLAKYVVYESKPDSSRFVEYWVPVQISSVQLEQYCATLLSNSLSLCSSSRSDPIGTLREILVTTRKCCDHPYIVDGSLQTLLAKDRKEVEYLDIGIKASGKLQFLDVMLADMKNQGLRVLVLFQSLGGSGILIGDILDDFVRQRFGPDSYERIDSGVIPSKKQSALTKFNKEKGIFIFLLEKRACLPSIKLSSVDAIILFDTDWNPINDVRSLQRITLNSPVEKIKLFRLYSSFTVEEKLLILARQDKHLDSNVQNISPNTSHSLLMWGAYHLFNKLDEFHSCTNQVIDAPQELHLKNVLQEFQSIFAQTEKDSDLMKLSLISQVKANQATYTTTLQLLGEQKIQEMNEDLPYIFWMKLLEGRNPQWKFSSSSTPRNRKRPQYFVDLQKSEAENAEAVKKRKKVVNDKVDTDHLKPGSQGGMSSNTDTGPSGHDEKQKMYDSQTSLHVRLKPELAELCEVFSLPEDVKLMAERLLEYFINNHHINREPETVLQAFQISLCWTAASLLKHKMDHKESLILARKHLKYSCTKEEVDYVYSLLRCLRGIFVHRLKEPKVLDFPQSTDPRGAGGVLGAQGPDAKNALSSGAMLEFQLVQRDLSTSIKDIQRKSDKKMAKLLQKQRLEKEEFDRKCEEENAKLEKAKKAAAAILVNIYGNSSSMTSDKLKKSESEYAERFDELKQKMEACLRELEANHLAAKNEINERKAFWLEALKSFVEVELVNQPQSQTPLSEVSNSFEPGHTTSVAEAQSSDSHPIASEKEVSIGSAILPVGPNADNVPVSSSCDNELGVSEFCFEQHAKFRPDGDAQIEESAPVSFPNVHGDVLSVRHSPEDHVCCESSMEEAERVAETIHSNDGPDSLVSVVPCLSSGEITDGATVSNTDGDWDASFRISETVGSKEGQGCVASPIREGTGEDALTLPNGSAPGKVTEVVISRNDDRAAPAGDVHETVSTFVGEGSASEAALIVPDGDAPSRASDIVISGGDMQNSVSENPPSEGQISPAFVTEKGGPEIQEDIVSSNSTSSKEQSGDAISSGSPSGLVPSVETEIALGKMSERVDTNQVVDGEIGQRRGIGGSTCQRSHSGEQSMVGLHQGEQTSISALGSQLPLDQVRQDLSSLPSTSSEVQPEDASNREGPMTVQVPEPSGSHRNADTVPSQSNQGASVIELEEDMQDLISGRILGSRTIPVTLGSSNRLVQNADAVSLRAPIPIYHDPLQTEMERISKERDQISKTYEETKLHLKSEMDKEIEMVLAQIRAKYEAKFKEKDSEYVLRKKELDSNFYQVSMNKILAEAFRFKCMDSKGSGGTGLPQEASLMQQLVQQQQNAPRALTLGLQFAGVAMPQAMAPNHQISSAPALSTPPSRPPQISSFPSSGNPTIVGSEIRAPAPHLQSCRSSAPLPANSLSPRPHVTPSQLVPTTNPLAPSPLLPRPSSMPLRHAVAPTTSQPGGTYISQLGANFIIDTPTWSAATVNPASCLPTELGSNLPRPSQQQSMTLSTGHTNPNPNPTQASEAADIVCISDDD